MFQEFKKFALRGNVLDMAIGIIIGASFTTIVNSLVSDIIMPPFGVLLGKVDFANLFIVFKNGAADVGPYASVAQAKAAGAVTFNYGLFINAIVGFLIVSFAVFLLVKAMNKLRKKEEAAPTEPPKPTREQELLMEIRDILREKN
ncbi:MAG: large conductance mechanosensitive channel protein MscL [Patescibacteria group bacterium]